jgi:hypothetical protein
MLKRDEGAGKMAPLALQSNFSLLDKLSPDIATSHQTDLQSSAEEAASPAIVRSRVELPSGYTKKRSQRYESVRELPDHDNSEIAVGMTSRLQ